MLTSSCEIRRKSSIVARVSRDLKIKEFTLILLEQVLVQD